MADLKNTYITLKLGNGGGGSIDPSVLEGYATSGDMQSAFTLISETQQVAAAGLNQLEGRINETQSAINENAANPCVLVSENIEDFIVDGGFKGGAIMFVPMEMYGRPRYQGDYFPDFLPIIEEGEWTGDFNLDQIPDMVFQPGYYGIKTFPSHSDFENQEFNPEVWKVNINCDGGWSPYAYELKDFIKDEYNDIGVYFLIKDSEDFVQYFPNQFRITGITWVDDHFELDTEEVSGNTPDMSAYYTSAQTEDAISAATSGKADAANVSANTGDYVFPAWNEDGVVTGEVKKAYKNNIKLNNYPLDVYGLNRDNLSFFAPTAGGTAGQILVSAGNGTPVWANDDKVSSSSVSTIWKGTQAEYDAITTKDHNTFYIIL